MRCIKIQCGEEAAPFYAQLLDKFEPVSCTFSEYGEAWQVSAFFEIAPDLQLVKDELVAASALLGGEVPAVAVEEVEDKDWLVASLADFPPIILGDFFIYGSHIDEQAPAGKIPLQINASTAFGSGEHATTQGCLLALAKLVAQKKFKNPLDMGCGSGILAIALAKLTGLQVVASDMDPEAINVVEQHLELNPGVGIDCYVGDGFADVGLSAKGPFDLIVANILANPLCQMANDMASNCDAEGVVVLSGLLNSQQQDVIKAYESAGFRLMESNSIGDWATVVMEKV